MDQKPYSKKGWIKTSSCIFLADLFLFRSDKLGKFVVSYEERAIFIPNIDKNRMFKVDLEYPFEVKLN